MKRSLKALLLAGVMTAAFVGPAAAPAHAETCVGIWYDSWTGGEKNVGVWTCDSCPSLTQGPIDGHFHLVLCAFR